MKWTAKLAVVAALAASVGVVCAWGQEAAVAQSANAVGVVKYTIPANGVLTCIALPLNPFDDASLWYWPNTSLAEQLPRGSAIYYWKDADWAYSVKQKSGWSDADIFLTDAYAIKPGQALFVKGPGTVTSNIVVSLLGELPVDETLPITLTGSGNLDMLSLTMYPIATNLAGSALADLPRGSTIYRWNGSDWDMAIKQKSSWSGDWVEDAFAIGEGMFVKVNGESTTVTETRPFDWDE